VVTVTSQGGPYTARSRYRARAAISAANLLCVRSADGRARSTAPIAAHHSTAAISRACLLRSRALLERGVVIAVGGRLGYSRVSRSLGVQRANDLTTTPQQFVYITNSGTGELASRASR